MTADWTIYVFKITYFFGWIVYLLIATNTEIPKRTVLMDSIAAAVAALWPLFLLGTYIYLSSDRLAREFPISGDRNDGRE